MTNPEPAAQRDGDSTSNVPPTLRRLTTFGHILPIASAAAFGAYLVLWIGGFQFYDHLGVTPEDVGFGYPGTVVTSSLSLLVFVLTRHGDWFVGPTAIISFGVVLWKIHRYTPSAHRFGIFAVALVVAVMWGVVTTSAMNGRVSPSLYFLVVWTGTPATFALVGWLGLVMVPKWPTTQNELKAILRAAALPLARYLLVLALCWLVISTFVNVDLGAPWVAEAVKHGYPQMGWASPWPAVPVSVRWLGTPATDPLNDQCVMYLGQANGTVVLFDVKAQRAVKVPIGDVALVVGHDPIVSCAPPDLPWELPLPASSPIMVTPTKSP